MMVSQVPLVTVSVVPIVFQLPLVSVVPMVSEVPMVSQVPLVPLVSVVSQVPRCLHTVVSQVPDTRGT